MRIAVVAIVMGHYETISVNKGRERKKRKREKKANGSSEMK